MLAAFRALAAAGTALTGIGIEGDMLYGPDLVRTMVGEAVGAGVEAGYREIESAKGHDAFLIEWDQLTSLLTVALTDGLARTLTRLAAGAGAAAGAAPADPAGRRVRAGSEVPPRCRMQRSSGQAERSGDLVRETGATASLGRAASVVPLAWNHAAPSTSGRTLPPGRVRAPEPSA